MLVKRHRGVGFFFRFSAEASLKQNPTQNIFLFLDFFPGCTMERVCVFKDERVSKRPKIQH